MFLTGKDFWLQYSVLIIAIAILVITQLPPVKSVISQPKVRRSILLAALLVMISFFILELPVERYRAEKSINAMITENGIQDDIESVTYLKDWFYSGGYSVAVTRKTGEPQRQVYTYNNTRGLYIAPYHQHIEE